MFYRELTALVAAACIAHVAAGQGVRLVDPNGTPVPYVNAYAPAIGAGTVSDIYGELELTPRMASAEASVPVRLSCVGFRDTLLSIGELRAPVRAEIVLAKADYTLARAEVSGREIELGKAKRLGFRKPVSNAHASFTAEMFSTTFVSDGEFVSASVEAERDELDIEEGTEASLDSTPVTPITGTEFGNVMRAKGRWRLDSVGANFSATEATCTYEVNVYAYDDGQPGERLHGSRHFLELTPSEHPQELAIDFSEAPIYGSGPFLVVLEAVTEDLLAAPTLHARLALGRRKRITRFRNADGTWRRAPVGVVVAVWADVRAVK